LEDGKKPSNSEKEALAEEDGPVQADKGLGKKCYDHFYIHHIFIQI